MRCVVGRLAGLAGSTGELSAGLWSRLCGRKRGLPMCSASLPARPSPHFEALTCCRWNDQYGEGGTRSKEHLPYFM